MLSSVSEFLGFEKRKYIDYEKLEKKIRKYLISKRRYKRKGKYYLRFSGYVDFNEKEIKSFLRKKKLYIKFKHVSNFFLNLANTFHLDINAYLNETFFMRRKSYRRLVSYLYLFIISTVYYSFRFIVFLFKKLSNKKLYENVWQFLKTSVPKKIKKTYHYYFELLRIKLFRIGDVIFQYIYRCILFIQIKFLFKIRAFFYKIYLSFAYMKVLKVFLKSELIKNASDSRIVVSEYLCKNYGLDYSKVLYDRNKLYKYLVVPDYYLHIMHVRRNCYFIYLKKNILENCTGNMNFKVSYLKIINLNLSRYFIYFFKNIWPHIYAISFFLIEYMFEIFSYIANCISFFVNILIFTPIAGAKTFYVYIKKIWNFFKISYWLYKTRKRK